MKRTIRISGHLAALGGVLIGLAGAQKAAAQFNDIQNFDGTANSFFAFPAGTVPYWSVADGCSPGVLFANGTRGDNGTSCLRSLLPTAVGTRMIRDLNPGPGSSTVSQMQVTGLDVIWRLWVSADDGSAAAGHELYRILGPLYPVMTLETDINTGPAGSNPSGLFQHNPGAVGRAYFSADDGINGRELWLSNTNGGLIVTTTMVSDINPAGSSDPDGFSAAASLANHLVVFAANDGTNGREIWKTDGTAANTAMVMDINAVAAGASSDPESLTSVVFSTTAGALDIRAFFTADDGVNGRELYRTNGTLAGTGICKDIVAGAGSSSPANLIAANPLSAGVATPTLFFTADSDGINGSELWKSRGALDGSDTVQVYDPGAAGSPANLTAVTGLNLVFFTIGNELWKSTGTAAGTAMVMSFAAPPTNLISAGSGTTAALFFAADDGTGSGVELWKSTALLATQVKDVRVGPDSSSPTNLLAMGATVYFSADDGASGRELWRTDNTAGALRVKDINPGPSDSNPAKLTNLDGTVVFTADDGTHGVELWQTDGFEAPNHSGMSYNWDLSSLIQAKTGDPAMIGVAGTDANPISVYWLYDFAALGGAAGISEAAHQINMYVELTDGTDRAPLAITNVDCGDGNLPRPRAALTDGANHNVLAFGMVSVLDQDPCDTDPRGPGSPGVPFAYVPAVYDGHDWIPMSLAEFPADVPTAPPTGKAIGQTGTFAYLHSGHPANLVPATSDPLQTKRFAWGRIDVWSDYMTVIWGSKQHNLIWVATLPRQYKGAFKSLYTGNGACVQPAYPYYTDSMHITGGAFTNTVEPYGACCAPAGCRETSTAAECSDGTFTPFKHCDDPDYNCCPIPWADHDSDGDVDSADFGKLQGCYTGDVGNVAADCICFDHNNDDKIDQTDLMLFIDCGTGPSVIPGSLPPGCE